MQEKIKELSTLQEFLTNGIAEYLFYTEQLKEIISNLYRQTELFEREYEHEFRHELFRFFANKITRSTREYNKLIELLSENEIVSVKNKLALWKEYNKE